MQEFMSGRSGSDRRTRIVEETAKSEPAEQKVLVTQTLVIKQLVPLASYDEDGEKATVDSAREYEIDLPEGERIQCIIEALSFLPSSQMETTVRVELADPGFSFPKE